MPKGRKGEKQECGSFLRNYLLPIIWAFLLAGVLRAGVVEAFHIPSSSMEPCLLIGDHLLVSKSAYGFKLPFSSQTLIPTGEPKRGDVVVFAPPEGKGSDFIKRIIGLPGETVETQGRFVFINGEKLEDPWGRYTGGSGFFRPSFGPVIVPKGHYFVMGDNRDHSYDSRFWNYGQGGFVPRGDIRGKAIMIHWSWQGQTWGVRWARAGKLIN